MEHTKQLLRVAEIETVAPYVNRYRFTAVQGHRRLFCPVSFSACTMRSMGHGLPPLFHRLLPQGGCTGGLL